MRGIIAVGLDQSPVAVGGELESPDRAPGEQADDDRDHRRDEPAERPAEDDDDGMFFTRRPSAPHQQRDHRNGA